MPGRVERGNVERKEGLALKQENEVVTKEEGERK